jgi:hypothetical protein
MPAYRLERIPGVPPIPAYADLRQTAGTYAEAFAGPPWNEYVRCPVDGAYFGKDFALGEPCPDDAVPLELAYPLEETTEYISRELCRPDAALFLLRNSVNQVRGFSWGFAYDSPEQFAAEKYKTPGMQQTVARLLGGVGIAGKFYYLSESGLADDPAVRGRGLSREFHRLRLEVAANLGLPAVQRTSSNGPMYRTSRRFMRQIMGPEAEADPVTSKLAPTGRVVGGYLDTENEQRTLFISGVDISA